jgi:ribonuclease Z
LADSPGEAGLTGPKRTFLVQRYARLDYGQYSLVGYSVAGEETVVQVPEMGVCFDAGRAPQFCLTSDVLCLTHAHMDHVAGLGYFLSQRYFQGLKPATVLLPMEMAEPVDDLLRAFRKVERQQTPYRLHPMAAGEVFELNRHTNIRTFSTHHGQGALGYSLVSLRDKLKPEYAGVVGHELGRMKREGVEITTRIEVPLVTFMGDTAAGSVFDHPDVVNARTLITECTFFDAEHRTKAKAGKHLHVEEFARIVPRLRCESIVVTHVSRRTGIRRAKSVLRKLIGDEQMKRIVFLMDFDGSEDAGDADSLGVE